MTPKLPLLSDEQFPDLLTNTDVARIFRHVYGGQQFDTTERMFAAEVEAAVRAKFRDALAALAQHAQEPVLFASPGQLKGAIDGTLPGFTDLRPTAGGYLPVRTTPAGKFTQALYTTPQPQPAPTVPVDAFAEGWRMAADWANRDDLLPDMDGPQYTKERDERLADLRPQAAIPEVDVHKDGDGDAHVCLSLGDGSFFDCAVSPSGSVAWAFRIGWHTAHKKEQVDWRPQAVPMTPEQIIQWVESDEHNVVTNDWQSHIAFVRAIEAHHGILPQAETTHQPTLTDVLGLWPKRKE